MSLVLLKLLVALLLVIGIPQKSDGQSELIWCIADEQTPDDVLQGAIDYTCVISGANCNMTQLYQPCNLPDTVKDHASWIFNNYYQTSKKNGGSCYFNGAAMLTELDPNIIKYILRSHRKLQYEDPKFPKGLWIQESKIITP